MIGFGNIRSDDFIQALSLAICLGALIFWTGVVFKARKPLLFVAPVIATATISIFYLLVLFLQFSTEVATMLSAIRTLIDVVMWLISGGAMYYIVTRRRT